MIRTFFKEVYDTSKLMKVVKKYSYAGILNSLSLLRTLLAHSENTVLQAQKYSRDFLAVQKARAHIILKFTEKIEPLWRKKQSNKDLPSQLTDFNRSNENISLNASRRAPTRKWVFLGWAYYNRNSTVLMSNRSILSTKKRKDDALDKAIYIISDTVKRKVLFEDLVKRKKAHRAELLEYENKLIQYTAAQKVDIYITFLWFSARRSHLDNRNGSWSESQTRLMERTAFLRSQFSRY